MSGQVASRKIATYSPAIFDVTSLAEARQVILTSEDDLPSARRWELEAPYLAALASRVGELTGASSVLDFGCGVGRMATALINVNRCSVYGVDISRNMRALAARNVESNFAVGDTEALRMLTKAGVRFDFAICCWVLQHAHPVDEAIRDIRHALKDGGVLLVVNNEHRAVPVKEKLWVDDGVDVRAEVKLRFGAPFEEGRLPEEISTPAFSAVTYWACYRCRR